MKTLIFLLILFITSNYAQISILSEEADSLVINGSNYIYNVQFDSAHNEFEKLITLYPKHPAGYFLDAMVSWWKITIHRKALL